LVGREAMSVRLPVDSLSRGWQKSRVMLKRISVSELTLGMYLQSLEGSWLSHPFWRTKFVLRDPADIDALRQSAVTHCWINEALFEDVAPKTAQSAAPAEPPAPTPAAQRRLRPEGTPANAPASERGPGPQASAGSASAAVPSSRPQAAASPATPAGSSRIPVRPPESQPAAAASPGPTRPRAPATPITPATPAERAPLQHAVELEGELERASEIVNRFKGVITEIFGEVRMGKAIETDRVMPFVEEVSASVQRNSGALVSLARLKTKDDYTYMHSVSVCALMISLARQLGLSQEDTRQAGIGGMLHDVGKMAVPDSILNKPGSLTDNEFAVMRLHPERGFELLKGCTELGEVPLDICLHHHERIDGRGYPKGLAGDQITLMSRMASVCDVYDAVTSQRAYKAAWDPSSSIQRMSQWKGQFDPPIFQAFVRSIGIYPVGTLVRMESERLGVVIDHNPRSLVKPRVRVFFSTRRSRPVPLQIVDLDAPGCNDRIVGRESPEDWGFTHLQELWQAPPVMTS